MKYIGVKIVDAEPMNNLDASDLGYRTGAVPYDLGNPVPGYEVTYKDGYKSWSPTPQFEEANRPVDGLCFGHAIEAIKAGIVKKVARKGWNGKGMYISLQRGSTIKAEHARGGVALCLADEGVQDIEILGHLDMRTADGKCCVGWLASQTDILADDWTIVE